MELLLQNIVFLTMNNFNLKLTFYVKLYIFVTRFSSNPIWRWYDLYKSWLEILFTINDQKF